MDKSYVTDLLSIESYQTFYMGHDTPSNIESIVIFKDQNNDLRKVSLYGDKIPGMIKYYKKYSEIKIDLIFEINRSYFLESDNENNRSAN
jgi:hypothetical protein